MFFETKAQNDILMNLGQSQCESLRRLDYRVFSKQGLRNRSVWICTIAKPKGFQKVARRVRQTPHGLRIGIIKESINNSTVWVLIWLKGCVRHGVLNILGSLSHWLLQSDTLASKCPLDFQFCKQTLGYNKLLTATERTRLGRPYCTGTKGFETCICA